MLKSILAFALAAPLLAACTTTTTNVQPRSPTPSANLLPSGPFPLRNARVLQQTGTRTSLVEVQSSTAGFSRNSEVLRAARVWCGGSASATPLSRNGGRFSVRTIYTVRCR